MILRLLSESDCYGYEIVKLIVERSHGEYELKEATMYSSVRRLEADGDIEWYWGDESQGGDRPPGVGALLHERQGCRRIRLERGANHVEPRL
jgi:hypothetical protein